MGNSADAYLVFGLNFGEEIPESLENDYDSYNDFIEDAILVDEGLTDSDPYEVKEEAYKKAPVTLVTHVSYDYPEYVIAVPGTQRMAWWGNPLTVTSDMLSVAKEKVDAYKKWLQDHDIDLPCEPHWMIVTRWG